MSLEVVSAVSDRGYIREERLMMMMAGDEVSKVSL